MLQAIPWTGSSNRDRVLAAEALAEKLLDIRLGVYVNYLCNDHSLAIHDRNGEKVGKGKLLIRPHLSTVKFGKFEGGLLSRRSEDAHHMHRREVDSSSTAKGLPCIYPSTPSTFAECLKLSLVLDLSHTTSAVVRCAERVLRRDVRRFLAVEHVTVQDFRGDYRILTRPAPQDFIVRVAQWSHSVFCEICRTPI